MTLKMHMRTLVRGMGTIMKFQPEFKKDDTDVVTEVVMTQPYGVIIAKKKM